MADLIDLLQQLGFSEYEARAYINLIEHHPVNGYTLAKTSGIPRANIYSVLQKLEDRGAALSAETEGGKVYTPVPPNEFIPRLTDRYLNVLETTQHLLEQITLPNDYQIVQNIQGETQFLEHARDLINRATSNLTLAVWQPEAQALAPAVTDARKKEVWITTLCLQACTQECGNCQGHIYRYHITSHQTVRWLIIIRDDTEMLLGTVEENAVAIRTHNSNLIELTGGYIRNSITLAAILSDLGDDLEQMLTPQSRSLLTTLGGGNSWLQYLHKLLKSGQPS